MIAAGNSAGVSAAVNLISLQPVSHPVPPCLRNLKPVPKALTGPVGTSIGKGTCQSHYSIVMLQFSFYAIFRPYPHRLWRVLRLD